jgi:GT2 family glycosyltransferase/glycosyltransferase involved in cell wall biosynthesis
VDPRARWGALVLCEGSPEWFAARVVALGALVPRICVVDGAPYLGLERERVGSAAPPNTTVVPSGGAVREALEALDHASGELILLETGGTWEEVANAALDRLGTYDVLVIGCSEFFADPLEVMRAFERSPEALSADVELCEFAGRSDLMLRRRARPLVCCRPGAGFRFVGPRQGPPERLDRIDAPLLRYGPLLSGGPPLVDPREEGVCAFLNSHPAPVERALRQASAAEIRPNESKPEGDLDVSILVPFMGALDVTRRCVEAILGWADPDGPSFEVLLRDDGTSGPLDELDGVLADPRVRLSRAKENMGFLRTVNAAAQEARGTYLVLLNNDTEPLPGWLSALVDCARSDPGIGAVGAMLLYPDGVLQEAGSILFKDAIGGNCGKRDPQAWHPRYQYRRDVDYCSGACLLVRRALWEELGGFDERFAPAYYEDADLCFALRARGSRVVYEPRARVVHLEGYSSGTETAGGVKRHQVLNRERFLEKWGSVLAAENAPPARGSKKVHALREPPNAQHVLVAYSGYPLFDRDAGSFRLLQMLEILRGQGCRVTFLARSWAGNVAHRRHLEELGVECRTARSHFERDLSNRETLGRCVRALVRERPVDLALLVNFESSRRVGRFLRRYSPRTPIVTDCVDVHFHRLRRQAEATGDPAVAAQAEHTRRRELAAYRKSDLVIAISDDEARFLQPLLGRVPVTTLGTIHPIPPPQPGRRGRHGILFVGSFGHPPNGDAVRYLVREILPLVWKEHSDLVLDVVGSGNDPALEGLASDRVRFLGFVADLEPLFRERVALVASMRFGAGLKGKITQALSYGLPVVTSTIGAEGMGLVADEHYAHAESPEQYATAIARVLDDTEYWETIAQGGRALIERELSVEAATHRLTQNVLSIEQRRTGLRTALMRMTSLRSARAPRSWV